MELVVVVVCSSMHTTKILFNTSGILSALINTREFTRKYAHIDTTLWHRVGLKPHSEQSV